MLRRLLETDRYPGKKDAGMRAPRGKTEPGYRESACHCPYLIQTAGRKSRAEPPSIIVQGRDEHKKQ